MREYIHKKLARLQTLPASINTYFSTGGTLATRSTEPFILQGLPNASA